MQINNERDKKEYKYRYFFIFFVIAVLVIALLFQFGSFMLSGDLPQVHIAKPARVRGSIYDRNGSLLALQTKLYNLSANKTLVSDHLLCAETLSPVIGLSEDEILKKFDSAQTNFLYIKKKMTESEKVLVTEAIKNENLKGLMIEEILNRTYPENKLASTLIGFLGDDGYGLAGIEYSAQNILSPPENTEGYTGQGFNVYLTIDNSIQYIMQKQAEKAMEDWKAESVIFLAANAKTGEILGYVSEPSPDLNNYTASKPEQLIDRPANYTYEPGSVFKIFSEAGLLDLGYADENTVYHCDGTYSFSNKAIKPITCLAPHGDVTAEGIIQRSCNCGIATMAENCPNDVFYNMLKNFGFGSKTGVELPGESAGIFPPSTTWATRTKPTIALGQAIGVTALQILEAATSFANDGKRISLSVISKITDADEKLLYIYEPSVLSKPISAKTAEDMLRYMKAENGIGWRAGLKDVPMSVKTGTAEIPEKGGYSKTDYVASCIALFPSDAPQIILYMAVIKPRGKIYGSVVVAPIISKVASEVIDHYGMTREGAINIQHSGIISTNLGDKIILGTSMPNLIGKSKKELQMLFNNELNQNIKILIEGEGYVVEQFPKEGTSLEDNMTIKLILK
ncbi:MAG: penicillin-binding protein [Treponemataceae bacterium]